MRTIPFREAIREALIEEMEADSRVFIMGEDIGVYGGARGVTRGLVEKFGEERVRDTPLSETAIIGGGMGAALAGMRPVCELMLMGFTAVCFDEIQNLAGKWPFIHGEPQFKVPMVIRGPFGAGPGGVEPHAQCPEAFFMHCPGLIVVLPSTPHDAKGLLKTAIRDEHTVLFFEHERLYGTEGPVPEGAYALPFGKAEIRRKGKDVTVVATAYMVFQALKAAQGLAEQGIELEVIDPRTLVPLDEETILESIHKTGRLIIVHEAYERGGSGAEIAAMVCEKGFHDLRAPILRLGAPNYPIPYSPALKKHYFPGAEGIESAVQKLLRD